MKLNNILEINNLKFFWAINDDFKIKINNFKIKKNEKVLLLGKSGSGKSTLLNLISGIIKPVSGSIKVESKELNLLSSSQLDNFRAENIGVIFQQFNLLNFTSPIDNILLPCHFTNFKNKNYKFFKERALSLGKKLNLDQKLLTKKNSNKLSVGQQQRISILRAVINMPKIILADEPTSALDQSNQDLFLEMLFGICHDEKVSLIMVSHDERLKSKFDKSYYIESLS